MLWRITFAGSAAILAGLAGSKIIARWQATPGDEAPLGQFPHVAQLRDHPAKEHFCSGAIVGKRSILTAAHCVNGMKLSEFEVVVGTVLNDATPLKQNVYNVARIAIHPQYDNLANDIAVVQTDRDIQLSDNVQIVKLGTVRDEAGAKLCTAGWSVYEVTQLIHIGKMQYTVLMRISICVSRYRVR